MSREIEFNRRLVRRPKSQEDAAVEAFIAEHGVREAVNSGVNTFTMSKSHRDILRKEYAEYQKRKTRSGNCGRDVNRVSDQINKDIKT